MNVIGNDDLNNALEIAYSKLMRKAIEKGTRIKGDNTLFAGIGEGGKSGSMISYHFRIMNELSEENFLSDETFKYIEKGLVENIILVDDILSTGSQAKKEIEEITKHVLSLGVKNIFLLTVCGMCDGIKMVEDETKAYVFSAFEYSKDDTVMSLDSRFYEGIAYEKRKLFKIGLNNMVTYVIIKCL